MGEQLYKWQRKMLYSNGDFYDGEWVNGKRRQWEIRHCDKWYTVYWQL